MKRDWFIIGLGLCCIAVDLTLVWIGWKGFENTPSGG